MGILESPRNCGKQISTKFWECVVCSSGRSADWSFHLGRSSYRRGVPQISAGELPRISEDMPLKKRGRNDGAPPHSSREVRNFLIYRFPGQWIRTWRSLQLAIQVSRFQPSGLLYMGMDERTGLQCSGGYARCIAWSHFRCSRPHQNQSAEAATINSCSSQPSGRLCCGRRWHFRKPALSTDKFKLKAI